MASFAKLKSGDWGVRVKGTCRPGQKVTVTTKAGASKEVTIGTVLWAGNGVSLCSIAGNGQSSGRRSGRESGYCGYPCPVTGKKCCAANGPCHDCM
jgi:hypothetical protein